MTKKDGKYVKISVGLTFQEHKEIRLEAERLNTSMSRYLVELHHNTKAMKDSKKELK